MRHVLSLLKPEAMHGKEGEKRQEVVEEPSEDHLRRHYARCGEWGGRRFATKVMNGVGDRVVKGGWIRSANINTVWVKPWD